MRILFASILALFLCNNPLVAQEFLAEQKGYDRVATAFNLHEAKLSREFADAGLQYPPQRILVRVLKEEQQTELWVADRPGASYVLFKNYAICKQSGELGPKRRSGDMQMPEGIYVLDEFNPNSRFHLSMHINYPNRSDLILGQQGNWGDNIFLHGRCSTIGCFPVTDAGMEEIYCLAVHARANGQQEIPFLSFPFRMDGDLEQMIASHNAQPATADFWRNLAPVYKQFEQDRQAPAVSVDAYGRYQLSGSTRFSLR